MKRRYRKGVFVVVYRKSPSGLLYLLLKRKLHWKGWEFPKGGVEKFELKKMAVRREVKEETGQVPIKIKKHKASGKYRYRKTLEDRPSFIGQTFQLYSAEIKNKKIIYDKKEHSDYKWVDFKTAMKLLRWYNQKKCLRIVNEYLTKK